jgi:uncharacterized NAD(P)/FAD-binding protein YdhS
MGSSRNQTTIAFIGGGPRAIGLLERINANVPSIAPDTDITILIYDPHPAGAGRVWRYDQSPSLKMNSLAEDVALFSDASSTIDGPVVSGPTLAEWVEQVRNGDIRFAAPDPLVAAELEVLGRQGFASRRLLSCYLRWFFEQALDRAPETVSVQELRATVERVVDHDTHQTIEYLDDSGFARQQAVDFVIYTVGHTDSQPTAEERSTSARATGLGLHYWPAHYAAEADFSTIPGGEPVLMRGLGLSFVDIAVRLTLDRGGTTLVDPQAPPGSRVTYLPSGAEPCLFVGSRRGVPYHSKITSSLHGERPGTVTTFLTREFLSKLLDEQQDVDFTTQVWPVVVKELAYWHYREIFTGHPERVLGSWEEVSTAFHTLEWSSEPLNDVIRQAVRPEDRFDIDALDRPLEGRRFASLDDLQRFMAGYIAHDLDVRASEEHSETLALFWAILASYVVIGELSGHPSWSTHSKTRMLTNWWHGFFSYVDSGPPAERLELLLALQRAGLLVFIGGEIEFRIDDAERTFLATGAQHPQTLRANYLIDAFHPERAIEKSAEPVLRDLIASGQGMELVLTGSQQPISTGRLAVDNERAQVLRPDGSAHPRRFAVGDFTSAPQAGTFARPGTNARIFRENDSVARSILQAIAQASALQPDPSFV